MADEQTHKRVGFTSGEKWIIWGVFCLLVGLSASRLAVFAGLMMLSVGVSLLLKRQRILLATIACFAGLTMLAFSKFLI